ncbi:MAG: hypothetical protein AAF195_04130 [Pseudomonadota bacterium]
MTLENNKINNNLTELYKKYGQFPEDYDIDYYKEYGKYLKDMVLHRIERDVIGNRSFSFYHNNMMKMDEKLCDILIRIGMMGTGEEFYYSYEKLMEIANDFIDGKEVDLSYETK